MIKNNVVESCYPQGHMPESSAKDFVSLLKPRVMSLVVFTAFVGMVLAPGDAHILTKFTAILLISIGAGASASINMWYDSDIDKQMQRTKYRPTATGLIAKSEALAFGIILSIFSVLLMGICVNIISAFLLAVTIAYYVFIYTMWLKRSSELNVVIGGVSGALPPVIGWSAITGDISLGSLSLFAIIFLWTPPHSWALAIYRNQDYMNCQVPMMPAKRGVEYTKYQILIYSTLMLISSYMPFFYIVSNSVYFIVATVCNLVFVLNLIKLQHAKQEEQIKYAAKRLFVISIYYLFIIFLSLLVLKLFI